MVSFVIRLFVCLIVVFWGCRPAGIKEKPVAACFEADRSDLSATSYGRHDTSQPDTLTSENVIVDEAAIFYKKSLVYRGITIKGSSNVRNKAFYEIKNQIKLILGKSPLFYKLINSEGIEIAIIAESEKVTDIPEYWDLKYSKETN